MWLMRGHPSPASRCLARLRKLHYDCNGCPVPVFTVNGVHQTQQMKGGWLKYWNFQPGPDKVCCGILKSPSRGLCTKAMTAFAAKALQSKVIRPIQFSDAAQALIKFLQVATQFDSVWPEADWFCQWREKRKASDLPFWSDTDSLW